tara:strand:- start:581 stop:4594 length:4014 start_codon:yes stop_codon:yes gene_type:complete
MPYIGQRPATGEANSFKILDEISSYTLTFDGSDAAVVSVANDTITAREHRFVTGQRVTYNDGGGTAITGLSDGVYYIIVEDRHTFKLASSANNAASGTAINLTGVGVGASHTLNVAFDGVNTKFKATINNGDRAGITASGQLMLSINGVLQEPHDNTTSPTTGYSTDPTSTIIFSAAPAVDDQFFGRLIASNFATFDISDNVVDNFTGDGSTSTFTLSKSPANNQNVLVTIDGVVQYPDDNAATRAYNVSENILDFASAPGSAVEIQVRHIGFAGATAGGGGGVTGFYGRTGNAVLKSTDDIVFNDATASGTVQAANVTVTGDLTVNGTTTTLDTDLIGVDKLEVSANNTTVAAAITQTGTGDILNLYDGATEVFTVTDGGNIGVAGATGTDYSLLDGMVINTANGSAGLLINSSSSSHNAYLGFSYGSGSSTSHADQYSAYIGRVGDNTLILGTDNNVRVRIDANGHMGLGVTPSAWATNGDFTGLQVKGASLFGRGSGDEDRGGIAVNYYHTGSAEKYIANGNAARIYLADGNIHFSNAPANSSGAGAAMTLTERIRITSDGRLSIGVNPSIVQALLNVKGDNDDGNQTVLLRLGNNSSGAGTGAAMVMGAGSGASSQGVTLAGFYDGTGTSFTIGTNASFNGSTTERLRITSGGELNVPAGIGPQIRFENQHSVTTDAAISTFDDAAGTLLCLGSNFYFNSSGSETRYNTGEESAGIVINRNGVINFNTGGTSATATTRLSITSDGNVGINDSNPTAKLSVVGNAYVSADSFTGENAGIFFSGWNDYGAGVYGRNSGNDLVMNAGGSERLRVISAGNVGIGEDVPRSLLHLSKGTGTTSSYDTATLLRINGTNGLNTLSGIGFGYNTSSNDNILSSAFIGVKVSSWASYVKHDLVFATRGVDTNTEPEERLRITSVGRVLIGPGAIATPKCGYAGIDVPNYDYSIVMGGSDGSGNRANNANKDGRFCGSHYVNAEEPIGIIRCTSGATASELHMGGGSSLINAATQLSFYTAANTTTTGGTERLRITSAGDVGIGVNPECRLHVEENLSHSSTYYLNADAHIMVDNPGSGKSVLKLEGEAALVYGGGSSSLIFADRQNERMRIHSNGKISVGALNNVIYGDFQVNQSAGNDESGIGILANDQARSMRLYCDNSSNSIINSGDGGGGVLKLNEGAGRVIIGTGGLCFNGDTTYPNALDDYEEGTYTPKMYAGTGTTEPAYNWRYGQYVKIGEKVTVWGALGLNGSFPSASSIYVGNLPYSQVWDTNNFFYYVQLHGYTWASGYSDSGADTKLFLQAANTVSTRFLVVNGAGKINTTNNMIGNNQRFTFCVSYVAG